MGWDHTHDCTVKKISVAFWNRKNIIHIHTETSFYEFLESNI